MFRQVGWVSPVPHLARTVLRVVPSGEDRYYLTTFNTGVFTLRLRLPQVLVPGGFPGYLTPPRAPGVTSASCSGLTRCHESNKQTSLRLPLLYKQATTFALYCRLGITGVAARRGALPWAADPRYQLALSNIAPLSRKTSEHVQTCRLLGSRLKQHPSNLTHPSEYRVLYYIGK